MSSGAICSLTAAAGERSERCCPWDKESLGTGIDGNVKLRSVPPDLPRSASASRTGRREPGGGSFPAHRTARISGCTRSDGRIFDNF